MTTEDETRSLLDRFIGDVRRVLPLVALWAHGSLALGDYQPGRSDLDLVALTGAPVTGPQHQDLQQMHELLRSEVPLAGHLHCAYMVSGELSDVGQDHLTWAHGELFDRPVSPVSRRELCAGGLSLFGIAPAAVVPAVTDHDLEDYIRGDLRDFWYPYTARADIWLEDIWVDLGMLTFARATVTLRSGRLITKKEALEVLATLDAPADVLRDIYQRRYGPAEAKSISEDWLARRGQLTRTYLAERIRDVLALAEEPTPPSHHH